MLLSERNFELVVIFHDCNFGIAWVQHMQETCLVGDAVSPTAVIDLRARVHLRQGPWHEARNGRLFQLPNTRQTPDRTGLAGAAYLRTWS